VDKAFLTDGILNGFKLAPADYAFLPAQQSNYKSATDAEPKPIAEWTILGEIAEGKYVITDVNPTIISALGAIPKPSLAFSVARAPFSVRFPQLTFRQMRVL